MAQAYKCDRCGEYHLDLWVNQLTIQRQFRISHGDDIRVQKYNVTLCPKCVSSLHLRDDISQNAFNDMINQLAFENPTPDPKEEKDAETDLNEDQITLDEIKEETTHETQHD